VTEEITVVFCPSCRTEHAAVVSLEGGFPSTDWLQPHTSDVVRRLVDDAGKLLALGVDVGDWAIAEAAASVLEINDDDEESS
jgi:hypothetical protein